MPSRVQRQRRNYRPRTTSPRWDGRFAQLRAHQREHGKSSPLGDSALGKWVTRQRRLRRLGRLSDAHIRRLDSIGFLWISPTTNRTNWAQRVARLQGFRKEHGHCRVPSAYSDRELVRLVFYSRNLRRQGRLPAERIAELDAMGFDWKPRGDPGADGMARLRAFHNEHGHCRIPINYPDLGLADFSTRVRGQKRRGTLPAQRIAELEAIGFDWNPWDRRWAKQMALLRAYRQEHGHCRIPSGYPHQGLCHFLHNARTRKARGILSAPRIAELDAIGFNWERPEWDWRKRMVRLRAFRKEYGHCRVPFVYPDRDLARFVARVRRLRREGRLPGELSTELEAVEFDRPLPEKGWLKGVARLRAFRNEHGHCWVRSTDPDRYLACFAALLRSRKRHGKLPAHKVAELDALGFDWNRQRKNSTWTELTARLRAFRKKHGHGRVPSTDPDRRLAHFVANTRTRKRLGKLSAQQSAELEAIGFEWKVRENTWPGQMTRLRAFRKKHGHCRVSNIDPDRRLVRFVNYTRTRKGRGILPAQHILELEAIGFAWKVPRKNNWPEQMTRLRAFRKKHGHCRILSTDPDQRLARFVGNVRRRKRLEILPARQIAELEAMGFDWSGYKGPGLR